ncbi:hypothetical protein EV360DRAFT_72186 [Lentinula raphanica]|nr:hypothetical protein EV360DRAFT_72186 [Lentinula raphanica]
MDKKAMSLWGGIFRDDERRKKAWAPNSVYDESLQLTKFIPFRNIAKLPRAASIVAGTPLNPSHIKDAEWELENLIRLKNSAIDIVTDEVLASGAQRVLAINTVQSSVKFTGDVKDIFAAIAELSTTVKELSTMVKDEFNTIKGELNAVKGELNAVKDDLSTVKQPAILEIQTGRIQLKLLKSVPGFGTDLANAVRQPNTPAIHTTGLPPAIGTEGTYDVTQLNDLDHSDILRLISYYNEDFKIVLADELFERRHKFTVWHTLYD